MFKYALKSIKSKKVVSSLYVLALSITLIVSMLSINISSQIRDGFYRADQKYDVIVGKKGSSTQLLMSSIFFSDDPLGTIPFSIVDDLKEMDSNMKVVPVGVGDNYNGRKIIGSSKELLEGYTFKEGKMFEKPYEIVVGSSVAKAYGLKVGSVIISSHGVGGQLSGHDHSDSPYTVVGILDKTNTAYDEVLFTDINDIWSSHSHSHEDGEEHSEEHDEDEQGVGHSEEHDDHEHEEGEHSEEHDDHEHSEHKHNDSKTVTSILIRSGSLDNVNKIITKYDTESESTQAINVTQSLRKLMSTVDLSKQIALLLSGLVVILSALIVVIMTYMLHKYYVKDLNVLNVIGATKRDVISYISIQNAILLVVSIVIALIFSRLSLYVANGISSKLGVILDISKMYKDELVVLVVISLISMLPILGYLKDKRRG